MNEKFVETVMRAKGWDRERAIAFLEEKFRCMEDAAKNGASCDDVAKAGMPLTNEELLFLMFTNSLKESCM